MLFSQKIAFTLPVLLAVASRNVLVPGCCLLLLRLFDLPPELIRQLVLTQAIPAGVIAIIIAAQFRTGEREMASSMALSVLTSIVTLGVFIWLTA